MIRNQHNTAMIGLVVTFLAVSTFAAGAYADRPKQRGHNNRDKQKHAQRDNDRSSHDRDRRPPQTVDRSGRRDGDRRPPQTIHRPGRRDTHRRPHFAKPAPRSFRGHGHYRRVWVPPVYRTIHRHHGPSIRVMIRSGCWRLVWVSPPRHGPHRGARSGLSFSFSF